MIFVSTISALNDPLVAYFTQCIWGIPFWTNCITVLSAWNTPCCYWMALMMMIVMGFRWHFWFLSATLRCGCDSIGLLCSIVHCCSHLTRLALCSLACVHNFDNKLTGGIGWGWGGLRGWGDCKNSVRSCQHVPRWGGRKALAMRCKIVIT